MKKLIALLLAAALTLSLAACGSNGAGEEQISNTSGETEGASSEITEEELLKNATELGLAELTELNNTMVDNMAKANSTYIGNAYKCSLIVDSVESDYCILTFGDIQQFSIHAYLPEEDLVSLNSGDEITIVGAINNLVKDEAPFYEKYAEMETVYLIKDSSENLEYEILTEDKFEGSVGKVFKFTACNISIESDYILTTEVKNESGSISSDMTGYKIYLSEDEMSSIQEGDTVDIIGKFSDAEAYDDANGGYAYMIVKPAEIAD